MPQIKAENVTLSYDGKVRLKNVNFSIDKGNYLCIVGENGAGKTTLLKAILGAKTPDNGSIELSNIKNSDIGYLPQKSNVQKNFPASVSEIIMTGFLNRAHHGVFYKKQEYKYAAEIMKKLDIYSLKNSCYRELSGGQQQRVLLARALCSAKLALVLDEPAASLDPLAADELYCLINRLNKTENMTIITVTHDLRAAEKYATHILNVKNNTAVFSIADSFFKRRLNENNEGAQSTDRGERNA